MDMNGFALGALFLQPVKSQIRNTLRYDQTSLAETSPNSTECVFFFTGESLIVKVYVFYIKLL